MRSLFALTLVILFSSQALSQICYTIGNEAAYNILPWSKQVIYNYTQNGSTSTEQFALSVSFCQNYVNYNGSKIYALLNFTDDVFAYSSPPNTSFWNINEPSSGISLLWNGTNGDNSASALLNISFVCSEGVQETSNATWGNVTAPIESSGQYYVNITIPSAYGCGISAAQLFLFLEQYKYIFGVIFLLLGIFICFYGFKAFEICLFLIGAIAGTFLSGTLVMEFVTFNSSGGEKWVLFGVCVLIGLVCGYLAVKFEKVGFFALGAALGVVAGSILYFAILAPIFTGNSSGNSATPQIVFYVTLVLLGIIGGLLGIWIYKAIIVISTSIVGAFLAIDSIASMTGFSISAIAAGITPFSGIAYLWVALTVIMAIGGMVVQFKHQKEKEDNDAEANPNTIYNNLGGDF